MRHLALVASTILILSMSGCTAIDDAWNDLSEDLEARDRFMHTVLLEETQAYSPAGIADPGNLPPTGPESLRDQWSTTFDVPNGTRTMSVLFTVSMDTPGDQPPPSGVPHGDVEVYVQPPADARSERTSANFTAPGSGGFDYRRPQAGTWTVGFGALGQGSVSFNVTAEVPVVLATNGTTTNATVDPPVASIEGSGATAGS